MHLRKLFQRVDKKAEKARFAAVGTGATTIDFGLLFGLTIIGLPAIAANFVSTGVAFVFSFFANRHYTFKVSDHGVRRQVILFIAVTLAGIWLLQPGVIFGMEKLLSSQFTLPRWEQLFLSKLTATAVTLVWNYLFYSKLVFKKR